MIEIKNIEIYEKGAKSPFIYKQEENTTCFTIKDKELCAIYGFYGKYIINALNNSKALRYNIDTTYQNESSYLIDEDYINNFILLKKNHTVRDYLKSKYRKNNNIDYLLEEYISRVGLYDINDTLLFDLEIKYIIYIGIFEALLNNKKYIFICDSINTNNSLEKYSFDSVLTFKNIINIYNISIIVSIENNINSILYLFDNIILPYDNYPYTSYICGKYDDVITNENLNKTNYIYIESFVASHGINEIQIADDNDINTIPCKVIYVFKSKELYILYLKSTTNDSEYYYCYSSTYYKEQSSLKIKITKKGAK